VNRADNVAGNAVGSFSFSGEAVCSLQFSDDLARSLFMTRASADIPKPLAFNIDYLGPLIKIDKPYIVINRMRKNCCPTDTAWDLPPDTIRGAVARYSSFENPEAAENREREPYSSQFTQRTAVFRINAGKLLDSLSRLGLNGNNSELLNAVITLRYHETSDSSGLERHNTLSRRVGNFEALILDTLLTKDIDTMTASGPHLLRHRFATERIGPTNLTTPYTSLSLKTALRRAIGKRMAGDTSPSYVYVYLRATTEYSTIWWCKPIYPASPLKPFSRLTAFTEETT